MKPNQYIVIVGCGRLGAFLANTWSGEAHSVVVVDHNPDAFQDLSPDFSGFRVEGDATQVAILQEGKIEQADLLITTTHDDNINLMVAQIAHKLFQVPRVIARLFDHKREEMATYLGVETICATRTMAQTFFHALSLPELSVESAEEEAAQEILPDLKS